MKWTQGYFYTLKENPADAEIPSHRLMVRGGYIRKLSQGIFTYGPLALRSLKKLEAIIREELDRIGCVELLMPMVHPKELWQETGRWDAMYDDLAKLKDRAGREHCLAGTHEEAITDFVRKDIKSYRDLPKTLYQIQTKFRNEIRPRFGLMRGREFIMKDAYSFDENKEQAIETYEKMAGAYKRIFERMGFDYRIVNADSGDIGGDKSQEFHVLADSGEDHLLVGETGDFAANAEVCPAIDAEPHVSPDTELKEKEKFATPGLRTIADLAKATGVAEKDLVKTMFFSLSAEKVKPIAVLLRGCDEVNPIKLKNQLKLSAVPALLTDEEVRGLTSASPGSCGPVGLDIPIYVDNGVKGLKNYIVGANDDDFHLKGINHDRDYEPTEFVDIRMAKPGDKNPEGEGLLKGYRGIEVGHIFYLGTKYSSPMNANYLDTGGKSHPIEMGCYGLGVSRTLQAAVEQCHDKDGIIWPLPLAPYQVHICLLDPADKDVAGIAEQIYDSLESQGVECLMDDREERPGVKFKDADLLGMPLRLTIGGRGVANGEIEVVERKTKEQIKVPIEKAVDHVLGWIESHKPKV